MSTRRILAGLGTLALIGGVALGLAACGTGSGDQVACASFYNTIDNAASASYAKDLAGLNTAAGQAVLPAAGVGSTDGGSQLRQQHRDIRQ